MINEGYPPFTVQDIPQYNLLHQASRSEISDACPNSRIAWNSGFNYQKVMIEGCMCLLTGDCVFTSPHLAWPIGPLNADRLKIIIDTLWPFFAAREWPFRMLYIDQANLPLIQALPGYQVQVSHNPNFSDYVYDAGELRQLTGKALHSKRNHVSKFVRRNPDYQYRAIQAADRDAALALVETWCKDKDIDCHNLCQSDYRAIEALFDNFNHLDIRGGTIHIGEKLAAFSLGAMPWSDTAIIDFEKADPSYDGIFAAINKLVLENEFPDALFVNREEDMGILGLRKSKLSYGPIRMIDKYEVAIQKEGASLA